MNARPLAGKHVAVLFSPWRRTGSGVLFRAQIDSYVAMGARVSSILVPTSRWQTKDQLEFWRLALAEFSRPGAQATEFARLRREKRNGRLVRSLAWRLGGRPSNLGIAASLGARAELSPSFLNALEADPPDLIHANHPQTMLSAVKVQKLGARAGKAPALIVDTHDVQSDNPDIFRAPNEWSRRLDSRAQLLRDELELLGHANGALHLSDADLAFFRTKLPRTRHFYLPATAPSEPPRQTQDCVGGPCFDFLFVGNAHTSNFESITWFLRNIGPLMEARQWSLAIVGAIRETVASHAPQLYQRFNRYFVGEVDDLNVFYRTSKVVIVPCICGTGASMKVLEAMALGKAVVASEHAYRGLPQDTIIPDDLRPARSALEFFEQMDSALKNCHARAESVQRFFATVLAEQKFRERHQTIIREVLAI